MPLVGPTLAFARHARTAASVHGLSPSLLGRYHMPKVLKCADLMPDCKTVIVGKDADEVFAKTEAHARKEHNMTIITPSVMSQIEAAIKDQ
jgi:predicted small metal-binding protein